MEPALVPDLICDPDEEWASRLMNPGPQLIYGMRGCGKTMLLRSLQWKARLRPREDEDVQRAVQRARQEPFLGLWVSCASLHDGPRTNGLPAPMHRLLLRFAAEAIKDLDLSERIGIAKVDIGRVREFSEWVQAYVPWYAPPAPVSDLRALEVALGRAFDRKDHDEPEEFNARTVFDQLAKQLRGLCDLWDQKVLLFLLDDVSQRFLKQEHVEALLRQLCLQSPDFGFKVSTETQTLMLLTPGGGRARAGRDYDHFDLGEEVLERLKGRRGAKFLADVLARRASLTSNQKGLNPLHTLGSQTRESIAKKIIEHPTSRDFYWGLEALTALCAGDIGEVVQIYQRMLTRVNPAGKVTPLDQHDVLTTRCERLLQDLARHDEYLYQCAISFAAASHRELRENSKLGDDSTDTRIRQYAEVNVRIVANGDGLFSRLLELVDAGIFVFVGATRRAKTPDSTPELQFKLAYRKALGLTNQIPLGNRDRFEPAPEEMAPWLHAPEASLLHAVGGGGDESDAGEYDLSGLAVEPPTDSAGGEPTAAAEERFEQLEMFLDDDEVVPEDHDPADHLYRAVSVSQVGALADAPDDWSTKCVIGAFGFEDRSEGAWQHLLAHATPGRAVMFQYSTHGGETSLEPSIRRLLDEHAVECYTIHTENVPSDSVVSQTMDLCRDHDIVVDTTSLTRALIYSLVLESLRQRDQVDILHTCAAEYQPPEEDLERVLQLLHSDNLPEAWRCINSLVQGELPPFTPRAIGDVVRVSGRPSCLAVVVPPKLDRLQAILDKVDCDTMLVYWPAHSDGRDTIRSQVARYLAEHLAESAHGEAIEVSSLDPVGFYDDLRERHRQYSASQGYNFEICLTGTKMHAVGAAMFASTASPTGVYYASPSAFDPEHFTTGTAQSQFLSLRRQKASMHD